MANARREFEDALIAQKVAAEYKGQGEKLYDALKDEWREVHYDEKKGRGWAQAGSLGRIEFQESGNDHAVIVTVPAMRFKAHVDDMLEVLEALRKVQNMV